MNSIVFVVDGRETAVEVPDARVVTEADMNRMLDEAGVGGHLRAYLRGRSAAQKAEYYRVGQFVEQGRQAYADAFNPNGPDDPPKCPYEEHTTEAVAWWDGWNTAEAMDAPDSD